LRAIAFDASAELSESRIRRNRLAAYLSSCAKPLDQDIRDRMNYGRMAVRISIAQTERSSVERLKSFFPFPYEATIRREGRAQQFDPMSPPA